MVELKGEVIIWHDLGVVIRVNWKMVNPKNKKVLAKYADKHLIANAMNILQEPDPIISYFYPNENYFYYLGRSLTYEKDSEHHLGCGFHADFRCFCCAGS